MNLKLKTKADRRQRPARQPLVQKRAKAKEHVRKRRNRPRKKKICAFTAGRIV